MCRELKSFNKELDKTLSIMSVSFQKEKRIVSKNQKLSEDYMSQVIRRWLDQFNKALIKGIDSFINKSQDIEKAGGAGKIVGDLVGWSCIKVNGILQIAPAELRVMYQAGKKMTQIGGIQGAFDVKNPGAVKFAKESSARLITEVTNDTRNWVSARLGSALESGEDTRVVMREIRGKIGLHSKQINALDKYQVKLESQGLSEKKIQSLVGKKANEMEKYRARLIARTETNSSYAQGTIDGFKQNGLDILIFKANEDACPQCRPYHNEEFTIDEAEGFIPVHPYCYCYWSAKVS